MMLTSEEIRRYELNMHEQSSIDSYEEDITLTKKEHYERLVRHYQFPVYSSEIPKVFKNKSNSISQNCIFDIFKPLYDSI